jgi:Zn-dependent protease
MILQYLDSFLKDPFATLLSLSLVLLSILVAVTIHEFSHALASNKLGDTTAKSLGRLTLNPKSHLDPLGSLLFLFVGFGWGKPVPVDIYRIKKVPPLLGMSMVSFAGPASNLATAILIGFCLKKLALEFGLSDIWIELGFTFVQISLVLAVFNLVPLPPLDGYKVILGILPKGGRGTRLKTARTKLICTKVNPNSIHISLNPNSNANFFKQNPIKIAVARLEAGPAKDTIDMPNKGGTFLILYMSTGTGLPHPNPTNKNSSEPSGSR